MSATAVLNTGLAQSDSTQATQVVRGSITLAGNYGGANTHGDVLSLALYGVQSSQPPLEVEIFEDPGAGNAPSGYLFEYASGSDPSNGQIVVLAPTGADAGDPAQEYPEGTAYDAGLLAAKLKFKATFPLGN